MSKRTEGVSRINRLASSLEKIDRKLKQIKDDEAKEKKHLQELIQRSEKIEINTRRKLVDCSDFKDRLNLSMRNVSELDLSRSNVCPESPTNKRVLFDIPSTKDDKTQNKSRSNSRAKRNRYKSPQFDKLGDVLTTTIQDLDNHSKIQKMMLSSKKRLQSRQHLLSKSMYELKRTDYSKPKQVSKSQAKSQSRDQLLSIIILVVGLFILIWLL